MGFDNEFGELLEKKTHESAILMLFVETSMPMEKDY